MRFSEMNSVEKDQRRRVCASSSVPPRRPVTALVSLMIDLDAATMLGKDDKTKIAKLSIHPWSEDVVTHTHKPLDDASLPLCIHMVLLVQPISQARQKSPRGGHAPHLHHVKSQSPILIPILIPIPIPILMSNPSSTASQKSGDNAPCSPPCRLRSPGRGSRTEPV
ncbi:hypothetical protein K504DRAFT_192240 [Pleomassaria siparia CBS 279.74]|uniref:Uncharacterized protein n=1 Tax=Pleomassaria siparia CBS 279.74 TaxID=1314801 RepID=A0A6G1KHX2_9PLEO|nr:hypothetical protein K504DRAFT_192240 [Pleomassaria siparia CBS 279.74]